MNWNRNSLQNDDQKNISNKNHDEGIKNTKKKYVKKKQQITVYLYGQTLFLYI